MVVKLILIKISQISRYRKVIWGTNPASMGNLICGTEKGEIHVYNPEHILASSGEPVNPVWVSQQHLGPVRALDVNPITVSFILCIFFLQVYI